MADDTLYDLRDVLVEAHPDLPRAREVAEHAGAEAAVRGAARARRAGVCFAGRPKSQRHRKAGTCS